MAHRQGAVDVSRARPHAWGNEMRVTTAGFLALSLLSAQLAACGDDAPAAPDAHGPTDTQRASCEQDVCEYRPPTADGAPGTIILGPDGAMWFTLNNANRIGRITLAGEISEYDIPIPDGSALTITLGPDNAIWFTHSAGKIGRLTTDGQFSIEFDVPEGGQSVPGLEYLPLGGILPGGPSLPTSMTFGPDGAIWFVDNGPNRIGRMTLDGEFSEYRVPTPHGVPHYIVVGPDGALWFTEFIGGKIGRITTDGVITEFTIPAVLPVAGTLTAGPDGNIWFGEGFGNAIGRLTMDGQITEFPLPSSPGAPAMLKVGPDGAIWFPQNLGNRIGRISMDGEITEFDIPTPDTQPQGIAFGPDGSLWFTQRNGGRIGVMPRVVDQFR